MPYLLSHRFLIKAGRSIKEFRVLSSQPAPRNATKEHISLGFSVTNTKFSSLDKESACPVDYCHRQIHGACRSRKASFGIGREYPTEGRGRWLIFFIYLSIPRQTLPRLRILRRTGRSGRPWQVIPSLNVAKSNSSRIQFGSTSFPTPYVLFVLSYSLPLSIALTCS